MKCMTTFTQRRLCRAALAVGLTIGTVLLSPTGASAAGDSGALAVCYRNDPITAWGSRGDLDTHIVLTLPNQLDRGRTFVRYAVAPTGLGNPSYTGWYWADNVALPGPNGSAFNSAIRLWTGPAGLERTGQIRLANTFAGVEYTVWQQKFLLVNGRWYGGSWTVLNRARC